jgi:hypothetical protein
MWVGNTSVSCHRYSVMVPMVEAKILLRKGGDRDNIAPILLFVIVLLFSLFVCLVLL